MYAARAQSPPSAPPALSNDDSNKELDGGFASYVTIPNPAASLTQIILFNSKE